MSPSWYDMLDVAPDATAEEIRSAWRARVADLDPTDRRFAVLNEAAAVLLDPDRRAAHDAEIAGAAERGTVTAPADREAAEAATGPARRPLLRRRQRPDADRSPGASAGSAAQHETPATGATADPAAVPGTPGSRIPVLVPVLLGVLAIAVAAAATWIAATVPSDEEVLDGTRTAQATAERAIVPVLSYDFRDLAADRAAALPFLTDDFRTDYEELFTQIEENAPSTRTVVEAQVQASAVTRAGEDRVQVLVFVDQLTTNAQTSEPVTYRNQVTVTMERQDDRWLVDDLRTTRG